MTPFKNFISFSRNGYVKNGYGNMKGVFRDIGLENLNTFKEI